MKITLEEYPSTVKSLCKGTVKEWYILNKCKFHSYVANVLQLNLRFIYFYIVYVIYIIFFRLTS